MMRALGFVLCVVLALFASSRGEDYPSFYETDEETLHCYSTAAGYVVANTSWSAPYYNPSLVQNNTLPTPPSTGWVWDWDAYDLYFDDGGYDAWDGAGNLIIYTSGGSDNYLYSNDYTITCGTKASATAYSSVTSEDFFNNVTVARFLYAPQTANYARIVDVFTNPTNVSQVFNISYYTNLGSDSDTFFSMDVYNATQGRALVSTDNYGFNNGGDPPVSENLYGPGASLVPTIVFSQYDDQVYSNYYNVEVPAFGSIALMVFYSQNVDVGNASLTALSLDTLPALALVDMPVAWSTVKNWAPSCGQFALDVTSDNSCPGNVTVSFSVPQAAEFNLETTYLVSVGDSLVSVNGNSIMLPGGVYSVITYVGDTGCMFEQQLVVTEAVLSAAQTAALCFGDNTWVTPALSSHGNNTFVFHSTGANYNTTGAAIVLPSGTYTLNVNSCPVGVSVIVPPAPSQLVAAVQYVNGTSTASVTVTGGRSPYSYQWSSSDSHTNSSAVNTGAVTVQVKDSNNCTTSVNFNVYVAPVTTAAVAATSTAAAAGDSTTASSRDSTTASAGDSTTASAGDSTTASAGDSTTASAGDSTTAAATTGEPKPTTTTAAAATTASHSTTTSPIPTTITGTTSEQGSASLLRVSGACALLVILVLLL